MDLHYLKLFHAVATHLSLSKAAKELHISQPAVSIQIKKLEEEIDLKLFERMGRQVFLTQSGQMLFTYTTKIFDLVNQAEAQVYNLKGTIWGEVQVGASNTPGIYIMPYILGEYKRMHPQVAAHLHIASTYDIENMLYDNQLDFAIMGGTVTRTDIFHVEEIMVDECILVVSSQHPLARKKTIEPEDLINEQYITHDLDSALFKTVKDIVTDMGLPFRVAMSLGSIDAIKHAAASNLGISIVPRTAVMMDLKLGMLAEIRVKNIKWNYPYSLVYHKGKEFAPAVDKLIKLCKKEIKSMGVKEND